MAAAHTLGTTACSSDSEVLNDQPANPPALTTTSCMGHGPIW